MALTLETTTQSKSITGAVNSIDYTAYYNIDAAGAVGQISLDYNGADFYINLRYSSSDGMRVTKTGPHSAARETAEAELINDILDIFDNFADVTSVIGSQPTRDGDGNIV